jgi:hypothetical protein
MQQLSDTKVQLDTREGKMGNLFKDQQFTLCSDPSYDPSSDSGSSSGGGTKPSSAPVISGPIIYPETIELLQNGQPVAEVYNRAMRRDSKLEKEFNIFEYKYDNSGAVIWEKGAHNVSWQECKFDVGLKGIFAFDFGDVEWENVRFGDLKNFKAYLDGDFNTDLILKYTLTKGVEASVEKTLVKDIFSYRVKFMVGTIPVWINLSSDLMASVEAKAEAQVSVSGGVRAHANLKGGVEWDADRGTSAIRGFDYQYEIVKPEVEAEAHAEAKAYVWPQINIGIYDVLCPTINPKPYVRAYADARTAEANKPFFGWNAGISAGLDLTLGLSLQLWKWKKEIAEIDPINLVDRDLVAIPTKIEMADARLTRNVMKGDTCHVKYRVKGYNAITGSEYSIPLACVKIEKNGGGEIDSEQWKGADYFYTNKNGEIDVVYTQTDTIPATLKATLITGDEERDKEAKEWKTVVYDYRLTALDVEEDHISASRQGKASPRFKFEQFVKSESDKDGVWGVVKDRELEFTATGGSLESAKAKTDYEGIAVAKFDGGNGFSGGSITAKVYIEEFDTLLTSTIQIDKFTFDDEHLVRCNNLPNNTIKVFGDNIHLNNRTVNLDGDMIVVSFASGQKDHTEKIKIAEESDDAQHYVSYSEFRNRTANIREIWAKLENVVTPAEDPILFVPQEMYIYDFWQIHSTTTYKDGREPSETRSFDRERSIYPDTWGRNDNVTNREAKMTAFEEGDNYVFLMYYKTHEYTDDEGMKYTEMSSSFANQWVYIKIVTKKDELGQTITE